LIYIRNAVPIVVTSIDNIIWVRKGSLTSY